MALDSVGSIFIASDDPLHHTKVISSVETRGDSLVIVGSSPAEQHFRRPYQNTSAFTSC